MSALAPGYAFPSARRGGEASSSAPLGLDAESTAEDLRAALEGHELAHGTLVGLFQR